LLEGGNACFLPAIPDWIVFVGMTEPGKREVLDLTQEEPSEPTEELDLTDEPPLEDGLLTFEGSELSEREAQDSYDKFIPDDEIEVLPPNGPG
jgi:hypothetical protein